MRIIQLNAWLGRLNGPLARFIAEQDADIVCLQEAYLPNEDMIGALADQYNFLDEVISAGSYTYTSFANNWALTLSGATVIEGNAILSRFPILDEHSEHTHGSYHVRKKAADAVANTRVWQSCQIDLGNNKSLSVANYQGYLSGKSPLGDNTTQLTMNKVAELVDALPRPLIICGDFNITPDSEAIQALANKKLRNLTAEHAIQTTLSPAHRAPLPDRDTVACDYIFVSDDIEIKDFVVSEAIISDHKALILDFAI